MWEITSRSSDRGAERAPAPVESARERVSRNGGSRKVAYVFRTVGLSAVLMAALLLGACSTADHRPAPPAEAPGYFGNPTLTGTPLDLIGDPPEGMTAIAHGPVLVITTVGSGSCPWVPAVDSIDDEQMVISVELTAWGIAGECTADSAPRTFELPMDRDVSQYVLRVSAVPPR